MGLRHRSRRSDAEYELVDLRDYPLPHLDEPLPPSFGQYQNEHTKAWADKIAPASSDRGLLTAITPHRRPRNALPASGGALTSKEAT